MESISQDLAVYCHILSLAKANKGNCIEKEKALNFASTMSNSLLWWRAHAWNISFQTIYGGQFILLTHLLTLLYSPTDAAPQFLYKPTPFIHLTV